jgi:hypothetical protein
VTPTIKPTDIEFNCGAAHPYTWLSELLWSTWASTVAKATGLYTINTCDPYCAASNDKAYAISITLNSPQELHGHLLYTRMLFDFVGGGSHPHNFTFVTPAPCPNGGLGCTAYSPPGTWHSSFLSLSETYLGNVKVGMNITEASAAAQEKLIEIGDGLVSNVKIVNNTAVTEGDPGLASGTKGPNNDSATLTYFCAGLLKGSPEVVTPEGFVLGWTVQQLKALYGPLLQYVPARTGGINPDAAYVVHGGAGNLVFWPSGNGKIVNMASGAGATAQVAC